MNIEELSVGAPVDREALLLALGRDVNEVAILFGTTIAHVEWLLRDPLSEGVISSSPMRIISRCSVSFPTTPRHR